MKMTFVIDVLDQITNECNERPGAERPDWIGQGLRELILLGAGSAGLIVNGRITDHDTLQELGDLPNGQDEDDNGCIRVYSRVLRYLVRQYPQAMSAVESRLEWLRRAETEMQAFYQSDAAFLRDVVAR